MLWLAILLATGASAQSKPEFDLAHIGLVINGQQICEDKGRLQDYPSSVMDQIIAAGPKAIPVLIRMIADDRIAKTSEPIICYWPGMAIGDIAFCILSDLFTDSSFVKTTIPGAGWNDLLGPGGDRPAWDQLHDFIKKHGRSALQAKWRRLWDKYAADVYWDANEKCFRLRNK
jgi:hypothetical protein